MALKILSKVFGSKNDRELKRMEKVVKKINSYEENLESLSDQQLKDKRAEYQQPDRGNDFA